MLYFLQIFARVFLLLDQRVELFLQILLLLFCGESSFPERNQLFPDLPEFVPRTFFLAFRLLKN